MNTFHVIFKTGKERWIRADYVLPIGENWDFYDSRNDTEIQVATFLMSEVETIVQVEE